MVTWDRRPLFAEEAARSLLRTTLETTRERRPFGRRAVCLLPDYLHLILTLPDGDRHFSTRWAQIKGRLPTTAWSGYGLRAVGQAPPYRAVQVLPINNHSVAVLAFMQTGQEYSRHLRKVFQKGELTRESVVAKICSNCRRREDVPGRFLQP